MTKVLKSDRQLEAPFPELQLRQLWPLLPLQLLLQPRGDDLQLLLILHMAYLQLWIPFILATWQQRWWYTTCRSNEGTQTNSCLPPSTCHCHPWSRGPGEMHHEENSHGPNKFPLRQILQQQLLVIAPELDGLLAACHPSSWSVMRTLNWLMSWKDYSKAHQQYHGLVPQEFYFESLHRFMAGIGGLKAISTNASWHLATTTCWTQASIAENPRADSKLHTKHTQNPKF